MTLILRQGFNAMTVDEICTIAGVTKGGFFHHFPNKEAVGKAAADAWAAHGAALYAPAWLDETGDGLDRLHRFFDIMSGFTENENVVCTCVIGMLSQEVAQTHPLLREATDKYLHEWTERVVAMLDAAKASHPPRVDFDSHEAAWFLNSLWQGSMLVGKACRAPAMIRSNLRIARRWLDDHFAPAR